MTATRRAPRLAALLLVSLLASGCAGTRQTLTQTDPWESVNRPIYTFNDRVDRYALRPVARAYDRYVPEVFRFVAGNFIANLADVYTAAKLRAALDEEIAAGRNRLVVDLDAVTFLDSTGLGVLVGRLKVVRNHSGWLRLVCTQDRVLRVFRITGLDTVIGIHDTLEDALSS